MKLNPDQVSRVLAGAAVGTAIASLVLHDWMQAWLMAVLAGMLVMSIRLRKAAYYMGWVDGRINIMVTMNEAQRRGLTIEEATTSVVEKDLAMMAEYLGERSARKFWTNMQAELAKSDGSREDLP